MVFDVSDFLGCWSRPITLKVFRNFKVDFEDFEECTETTMQAVVQLARPEELKIEGVDYSKRYILIHSESAINVNNRVNFDLLDFIIISKSDYDGYGYFEAIGEEIK